VNECRQFPTTRTQTVSHPTSAEPVGFDMRQIGGENVECDPAERFFGHATAPPPSSVMNARLFD